jgi:hypothetical protein
VTNFQHYVLIGLGALLVSCGLGGLLVVAHPHHDALAPLQQPAAQIDPPLDTNDPQPTDKFPFLILYPPTFSAVSWGQNLVHHNDGTWTWVGPENAPHTASASAMLLVVTKPGTLIGKDL